MASFSKSDLSSCNSTRCGSSSKTVFLSTPNLTNNKGSKPLFSGTSSIKCSTKRTADKSDASTKVHLKGSLLNPKSKIELHSKESDRLKRGPVKALRQADTTTFRRGDTDTRKRHIERNILEAQYLQSMYMSLISQEALVKQEKQLMSEMEKLWYANKELAKTRDLIEERKRRATQNENLQAEIACQTTFITKAIQKLDVVDKQLKFTFNEFASKNEQFMIHGIVIDEKSIEDILQYFSHFKQLKSGNDDIISSLSAEVIEFCSELNKSIELRKETIELIDDFKKSIVNKEKLLNTQKALVVA